LLDRIADACALTGRELVIEIGGGTGSLTECLIRRAGQVVTIEKDPVLAGKLRSRFSTTQNLRILEVDIRNIDLANLALENREDRSQPAILCGNIPYYLSSFIVQRFVDARPHYSRAILLVQYEFARRCAAWSGSPDYGSFSVFCQYYCESRLLFRVPRGAFSPPPKVESALLELRVREKPLCSVDDEEWYFHVTRTAFGVRRKKAVNALADGLGRRKSPIAAAVEEAGLDPEARAEDWSPHDFARVAAALARLRDLPSFCG